MTVRVATVLSARDWEPNLVAHAHETASIRIVLRAFQPSDLESRAADIDVVVASGDVSWVTPRQVTTWKRLGLGVVGVFPAGDQPAADLLTRGGANEVVPDVIDAESLVQAIRFVAPRALKPVNEEMGTVTVVAGARGAPGCTEIALAYALSRSVATSTVLVDLDLAAPAIAVRLGLPPRPDLADVADAVRIDGTIGHHNLHMFEGLAVITGSHRKGQSGITETMVEGAVDAARGEFDEVIVDCGAVEGGNTIIAEAHRAIIVVDASAVGIVRAAQLTAEWVGPVPYIVVNRVNARSSSDAVEAVKRWTGLEPVAVIPDHHKVRQATIAARRPHRRLCRAMAGVGA
jgi:MinD-like ATPase involved in chromosome partitioning or flagellar assembly